MDEIDQTLSKYKNRFSIMSLNIHSSKFDSLLALLSILDEKDFYFNAICLQETWLSGSQDRSPYAIPGYQLINCPRSCSIHSGLIITRDSEVIMFSPCVFVCLCVCGCLCLSRCLSGRFNYEGLVPHKQYFAGTLLGMSSCASYVSHTHDVIDDVTRSQSRSNFESDISPSIFELQRRSKLKMSEMLMAIFLVYSTSGITSGKKNCRELKMAAILKILKY